MTSRERREKVRHLQVETYRLFLRRRHNALRLAQQIDPEIEPASYSVLNVLQMQGPQRMTAIAKHLGIGKPTLSRQLSTLADRGFITKSADPDDGRALVIDLTVTGRERLESAQNERSERYVDMLNTWSLDEVEQLAGLLGKLNQTYIEYDADHGPGFVPNTVAGAQGGEADS